MSSSNASNIRTSFIVICIAIGLILHDTWASLFTLWTNDELAYSHGLLSLPLAIWSAYGAQKRLSRTTTRFNYLALACLAVCSVIWFLSDFLAIQVGTQLMVLPLIYLTLASIFGFKSALVFVPALIYLLFTIPVWDYGNTLLQSITTAVATSVLEVSGLAVYIEGNRITIPYGTFEIAGGCSGLRYLLVALVLVMFFSQQRPNTLMTTLKLFSIALLFGLLANWIRVVLIILIGYESEMQSSIVEDHEVFGWFVFIGTFIPACWLLNQVERHAAHKNTMTRALPASQNGGASPLSIAFVLLILCLGPMAKWIYAQHSNDSLFSLNRAAPLTGWTASQNAKDDWQLQFEGSQTINSISYTNRDRKTIQINALYYPKQTQGQELVGYYNRIAAKPHWTIHPAPEALAKPDATDINANLIICNNRTHKLIYSYYKIGNRTYTNEFRTKIAQLNSIIEPDIFQGFIAYGIDCVSDCSSEAQILAEFIDSYETKGSIIESTASFNE